MNKKKVIIIGGGPAGLSAALKLSQESNMEIIIYELEAEIGGLSRTLEYKDNKMDIGPHRFFSKSDLIVNSWTETLNFENNKDDNLLIKDRYTRIYFLNKFFKYPIKLSLETLLNLGLIRTIKIGFSYFKSLLFPIKPEMSLKDFFINRFGKELYLTFFKDYTEKVWGVPCSQIGPSWGAQRVKGLSINEIIIDTLKALPVHFKFMDNKVDAMLTKKFYYPKGGSGMMWTQMAKDFESNGGKIFTNKNVISIKGSEKSIEEIVVQDTTTGEVTTQQADYYISSMPVKDLLNSINEVPESVLDVANNLVYRDLIMLGMLFDKFKKEPIKDNWIYLQDRTIKAGRMEIYNNFSTEMLNDKNTVWLGLEYFCNKGDAMWEKSDEELLKIGRGELAQLDFFNESDYLDGTVFRIEKAYPSYFGSYDRFYEIREYVDKFENLFLIGRNGMHRYNNMDHSMLSGFAAADNILGNIPNKNNIWDINTDEEYHES